MKKDGSAATGAGKKVKFAMAFHGFQPVFNFEWELEKAFDRAYRPFLEVLKDFPGVKGSFHFSGNILEWFEKKRPEYLDLLKVLEREGQIEIMGGGFFEPIMALIPERDSSEQIGMMNQAVERIFGAPPKGAWTTERVWTPELVDTFSAMGIKYTILDDHHLLSAGIDENGIFGPHRTNGKDFDMVLFPALTRFRYSIPFRKPEETVEYMRRTVDAGGREEFCFFFADDLEKFGAWPRTYRHVYRKGWLRRFFTLLMENRDWLETDTYSGIMDSSSQELTVRVPGASYPEMDEWSGGKFRNFLKKYPESGRMHERMLAMSEAIERASSGKDTPDRPLIAAAKKELFKAQTGCPYWHGTFGGVYLPHLRSGVYRHLIMAENILDRHMDGAREGVRAAWIDSAAGRGEMAMINRYLKLYIRPSRGAAVEEIDFRRENMNLVNSISRRREKYHKKLEKGHRSVIIKARKAALKGDFADIHEILGVREKGLGRALSYDDYLRGCFLTRITAGTVPRGRLACSAMDSDPGFLEGNYSSEVINGDERISHRSVRRDKVFTRKGGSIDMEVVKNVTMGSGPSIMFSQEIFRHGGGYEGLRWASEFNFFIWEADIMKGPKVSRVDRFTLRDRYSGISLDLSLDRRYTVVRYPVYTVNETESGLGKTFQGVSVLIGDEELFKDSRAQEKMLITVTIG